MTLFSLNPALRFVDGLSPDLVDSQTQILLSGFFEVVQAKEVHIVHGTSPVLVDLIENETGMPFRVPVPETAPRIPASDAQVLTPAEAAGICASRLKEFPRLPNISGGISFGIDHTPDNPGIRGSSICTVDPCRYCRWRSRMA